MYTTGDFLIRIKNAYLATHKDVVLPYSRVNAAIGKIMVSEGYLKSIDEKKDGVKKSLVATLLYKNRRPALTEIKIVSSPALHVYSRKNKIPKAYGIHGVTVLTTNKGIITDKDARKKGVGGKVICQLF